MPNKFVTADEPPVVFAIITTEYRQLLRFRSQQIAQTPSELDLS